MKRVVVTGGSGVIGRALIRRLAEDGYEVIILSRSPESVRGLPENVRAVGWDAESAAGWAEWADGAYAIVNLAGESIGGDGFLPPRWTKEKRHQIRESRRKAGAAVVEAVQMAKNKPNMVLQVSAIGYYGPRGDEPLAEDAPPGGDFLADVCQDWEASTAPVEAEGVRRVVARVGLVFTTLTGPLPRMLLLHKLFVGGPFASGKQYYSWIHLDDVAAAMHFLIECEECDGAYNLTAPNPERNKEVSKVIGEVLHRPHFLPVPRFAMRVVVGDTATLAVDGQRVLPVRLEESGYVFRFPRLEPAVRNILKREDI